MALIAVESLLPQENTISGDVVAVHDVQLADLDRVAYFQSRPLCDGLIVNERATRATGVFDGVLVVVNASQECVSLGDVRVG